MTDFCHLALGGGGYRISLSPWSVFGYRGWNGGYFWPWRSPYGYWSPFRFRGYYGFHGVGRGIRLGITGRTFRPARW